LSERELRRARSERRWADADAIAQEIDALSAPEADVIEEKSAAGNVIAFDGRGRGRSGVDRVIRSAHVGLDDLLP
jgi:hypothetical protein